LLTRRRSTLPPIVVDPSGNVWLANLGLAAPLKSPQIGAPEQP
jgi:hypothetical protein